MGVYKTDCNRANDEELSDGLRDAYGSAAAADPPVDSRQSQLPNTATRMAEPENADAVVVCGSGSGKRPGMHRLTTAQIGVFVRAALQCDASGFDHLSAPPTDGVVIAFESR